MGAEENCQRSEEAGPKIAWAKDFIVCFEGLLPGDLCREIIGQYDEDPGKRQGLAYVPGDRLAVSDDKISIDLELAPVGPWAALMTRITERVALAVETYVRAAPGLQVLPLQWSGYNIKRYVKGEGQFKWHFDTLHASSVTRQLAIVLYLNTVTSGGETEFHHQRVKASPVEGNAIIFPTFWTHMHRGCVPISNDKYIITSFVRFVLDPMTKA